MNLLNNFKDYKIVNINGQVVKKKSPWVMTITSLFVLALIVVVFVLVKPSFSGHAVFFDNLKHFFNFGNIKDGPYRTVTATDTLMKSLTLLWQTILYSLLGTILGIIISLPLAFASSKAIVKRWYIYTPFRVVMSIIRAIPPLVIAFLMFNVFSQTLSASLAIAVFVMSIMTKWLYEELDSIDLDSFVALRALGNQKNRAIVKAVMPYLIRSVVSYGFYAFEMVIRFAAILGVVGISTIGQLLSVDYKPIENWGHMSIVLSVLIVAIILIEIITMLVKKYLLNYQTKQIPLDATKPTFYKINYVKSKNPKKWIINYLVLAAFVALTIYSVSSVTWSLASPTKVQLFKIGISNLFHPDTSYFRNWDSGFNAIHLGLDALLVAIAAVVIGLFFSLIFGILASRAITGNYISWLFKLIIVIIRSVPAFVYAIMFVFLSPMPNLMFSGVLALGIHSIGMLGKLTYEKIDSIDLESRNALEVMGATRLLSTRWAIISQAMPTILSNALYRIEICFKSSVEIGAVGASAFGLQVSIYAADPSHFSDLSSYLIVTLVIVLVLEQISNALRRKLMTGSFLAKNNILYKKINAWHKFTSLQFAIAYEMDLKDSISHIKYVNYIGKKLKRNKINLEKLASTKEKLNIEKESLKGVGNKNDLLFSRYIR